MSEPDSAAARDTISRYGRFIDDRDWAALVSILADTVALDFTSLWGGEPEKVTGTELVARWREMSERLDATQHLITGILPEISGETATVVASLMAVHRRASAAGGPALDGRRHLPLRPAPRRRQVGHRRPVAPRGLGGRQPGRGQRGIGAPGGPGESFGRPDGLRKRVRNPERTTLSQVPRRKMGQANPVIPWKL